MHTAEYEILKKYKTEDDIDEKDKLILEELQSRGYVKRFGFSFERGTETTGLTEKGKVWLHRERIFRNPVKRFLHNWYVCLVS